MSSFREIAPENLNDSAFRLIGKDWILITAPDETKESGASAMTASWGGIGVLWNKPVATVYVRPQRYTYGLCERSDRISLCILPEEYRAALTFCGRNSGRDLDKLKECKLDCTEIDGVPVIDQAKLVMICKKAYADNLKKECFIDTDHIKHYPADDFHRVYILEIEKILVKE
ncbi:MAG: flavin reductase family protein [Ruminococcaceae bacterium]|nr:flavin reductase family protein [Oscillospiraceae bacterium]